MEIVSVTKAAEELRLSTNRVRELIHTGSLPAQKLGREWAILRRDLEMFKQKERPPGRPSTKS
jgi:excisionase family DNA binding protein